MTPPRGFRRRGLRWPGGWPSPLGLAAVMLPSFLIAACAASVTTPAPRRPSDVPAMPQDVPAPAEPDLPPRVRVPLPEAPGAVPPAPTAPPAPGPAVPVRTPPTVRIALTGLDAQAQVRIDGAWTLRTEDGTVVDRGSKSTTTLGALRARPQVAVLVPASDGDLRVGTHRYRGRLVVGRPGTGADAARRLAAGNPQIDLDVETYLEGVVAGELPPDFTREARRAQAIVARTYLLSQPTASWTAASIAVDDTGLTDQEFVGIAGTPAQQAAVRDAVESTRGMTLFDGPNPVRTWYHSICGGHTCSSAPVFHVPATGPLSGVVCTTCVGTKYYRWSATLPGAKVVAAAKLTGSLRGFRTVDTTAEGRAVTFEVRSTSGTAKIGAPEFRLAVGPRDLRSIWLDRADVAGGDLVVMGRGWGHGVGMCQWGANGMAARGATAEEIVAHYYPGAAIRRLW